MEENIVAKVAYINTVNEGLCVWSETAKDFIPFKQLEEHYEKVANELGFSLYNKDNDD